MGRLKFLHPTLEELFNSYCSPSQPHMSGRQIVLAAILLHQCPGLRQRRGKTLDKAALAPGIHLGEQLRQTQFGFHRVTVSGGFGPIGHRLRPGMGAFHLIQALLIQPVHALGEHLPNSTLIAAVGVAQGFGDAQFRFRVYVQSGSQRSFR